MDEQEFGAGAGRMQPLDFDDVLGLTVEMLKLKGAQDAKDEEVAQVVAVLVTCQFGPILRLRVRG